MGWYTKNLYFYPGFFLILKIYLYSIKNKKTIFGGQIWSNFATQVRFLFEKSEVHFYTSGSFGCTVSFQLIEGT